MNFNFSEKQKTLLASALIAVLIAIAALAGYQLNVTPAPTQGIEFGAEAVSPIKFANIRVDGTSWLRGAVTASSTIDLTPAAITADTSQDLVELVWSNNINTTGTNTQSGLNLTLTNANHTGGTNNIYGLDIDGITADAQGTEYAINVDAGWDRALNIAGGGAVIVGTFTVDAGEIGAAEIADTVRAINVPLSSFIDCQTDAGALIGFDTTADALADYVNSATDGTGFVIRFDDTASSEDQASEICNQFTVPPDYASGGEFRVRALKDAHTAATEVINCAVSVNGAALQAVGTVTTSASASTIYTCTPTIAALAVNDTLSFYLSITSDSTMNDLVDVASVEFVYTATQ